MVIFLIQSDDHYTLPRPCSLTTTTCKSYLDYLYLSPMEQPWEKNSGWDIYARGYPPRWTPWRPRCDPRGCWGSTEVAITASAAAFVHNITILLQRRALPHTGHGEILRATELLLTKKIHIYRVLGVGMHVCSHECSFDNPHIDPWLPFSIT